MRIRKNAKLSPLLFSHGGGSVPVETFQTHVCQLNQSPWDVIPFPSDDSPNQFEGEDSFTGNGSHGDSIGAVESVASMMDVAAEEKSLPKLEDMVVDDNIGIRDNKGAKALGGSCEREKQNGIALENKEGNAPCCQKSDGKGWQCKNEAKQGQSFCEHHLSLHRSYNSVTYNTPSYKKTAAAAVAAAAAAGARRARARSAKKGASSSNPYEFYYYSGFGPSWGKRRGDRNVEASNNEPKAAENSTITEATVNTANAGVTTATATAAASQSTPSSSSQIDNEEFDYVDDDEEDEANGDSGKKRTRKPVKARSLKSLM